MAKYLYVASVDCRKKNECHSKSLEFEADEKNFNGTSDIAKLNQVALRLVKNQNGGEIVGYDRIEIRGYSQKRKIENETNSYRTKTSSSKTSKSLFSYDLVFIPFILIWRILKLFGNMLKGISKFLD